MEWSTFLVVRHLVEANCSYSSPIMCMSQDVSASWLILILILPYMRYNIQVKENLKGNEKRNDSWRN